MTADNENYQDSFRNWLPFEILLTVLSLILLGIGWLLSLTYNDEYDVTAYARYLAEKELRGIK